MYVRRRLSFLLILFVIMALAVGSIVSCSPETKNKQELKVIIAGSLLVPFQAIEKEYESMNPDIDVLLEGHGSVQAIRSVTELATQADLVAVADAQLIPLMMYSTQIPESNTPYADWCIKFSTNRLGIAYKAESTYSSEINAENWYEILSRPDVNIGLADPRIDAMGYRTLMAIQLAEDYYQDDTVFDKVIGSAFDPAFQITKNGNLATITVPDLVKSTQQRVKLRGYSIQLMSLLESGDLDYSFEYESVAKQRGLQFLSLPEAIDLSSPDYEKQYQQVAVNLDFKRFTTIAPNFQGTQIVYGVTIPTNAPHPQEAVELLEFLLGANGQRILNTYYQSFLPMPECDNVQALPEVFKPLFR